MNEFVENKDRPYIMLIDDRPEEVRALINLLYTQSWRVSLIDDPQRGYLRAVALRPNLILLDLQMPGMDGFALFRLLREAPETHDIPVIFLTTTDDLNQKLTGFALGGVDYIVKPFVPEEVLARIRVHLRLAARRHVDAANTKPVKDSDINADAVLLRAATRFIEEHLESLPTLTEIAQRVGTHEKRLSRIFRQHMGCTVFAFVRQVRLRKSKELLAKSELGINDIAQIVGFQSAANFATAFREQTGMTPTEFRNQLLKDEQEDT